ncbi:MAG: ferrochelatase [Armatimonadetes bacterium]|nr:ferrochelatase [Armatimonadota bacterium]MDW8029824.1 ferrochelatase [Armatimonadota bacterium]
MAEKWGILLMAYGGPNSIDDVEPYYTHILRGRKPSPEMLQDLVERYLAIGGKSPINEITFAQSDLLQKLLESQLGEGAVTVYVGMKHWHPYIFEAIEKMASEGITDAVGIVLAPHYSRRSVAEYIGYAKEAMEKVGKKISLRFVTSWATHPLLIQCFASKVRQAWSQFPSDSQSKVCFVFTAHSLPKRILDYGDPYPEELKRSCEAVANEVGIDGWRFAYQSASGEDWLEPDILDVLEEIANQGQKHVLVIPIGFLCDHLEVLYDIDIEAKHKAEELGMELRRIEMPNTDPLLISALADIAVKAMKGLEDGFKMEISG